MEKIFQAKEQVDVAITISDKIDFKLKLISRARESYHTLTKGKIQQGDFALLNIYPPHSVTQVHKENSLNHIDSHTLTVRDFNIQQTL